MVEQPPNKRENVSPGYVSVFSLGQKQYNQTFFLSLEKVSLSSISGQKDLRTNLLKAIEIEGTYTQAQYFYTASSIMDKVNNQLINLIEVSQMVMVEEVRDAANDINQI